MSIAESFAKMEKLRAQKRRTAELSHPLAVFYIALSVLIMSFPTAVKVVPVLTYFALWLPFLVLKGSHIFKQLPAKLWVLSLPILCILSAAWSDYPSKSLYLGTSFLIMMLCVIVTNSIVSFRSLLMGLCVGINIVLLLTLYSGHYGLDYLSGTYSLIGYFGSKNSVGFTAELGILTHAALFFSTRGLIRKLLWTGMPMLLCILCLDQSQSGTAILSLVVAIAVTIIFYFLLKVPGQLKSVFLVVALFAVVGLIILGISMGGQEMVLSALGKDATLTGRTYLWDQGIKVGMAHPVWGHGYWSFWVQGNPLAERYWHEFFITARAGFHFHSMYVQTFVDLGAVGLALVVILVLRNCITTARGIYKFGMGPETALLFAFAYMFLVRSFAEVDFNAPFSMGPLLFYSIPLRLDKLKHASSLKKPIGANEAGDAPSD